VFRFLQHNATIDDTYPRHFALSCGAPSSSVAACTLHTELAVDSGLQIPQELVQIVSLTGN